MGIYSEANKLETYNFSIARFIPDLIRDEPINIGTIINDSKSNTSFGKFVDIHTIKSKTDAPFNTNMLKHVLEKLDGRKEKLIDLKSISSTFSGRLSFTSPRAVKNKNIDDAMNRVFDQYVSIIKHGPIRDNVLLQNIKDRISESIRPEFIHEHYTIGNRPYSFKVDVGILSNSVKSFIHILHYVNPEALLKDCLFQANCLQKLRTSNYENEKMNSCIIHDIPENASEPMARACNDGIGQLKEAGCKIYGSDNKNKCVDALISVHAS